jgi:hypothetical protein
VKAVGGARRRVGLSRRSLHTRTAAKAAEGGAAAGTKEPKAKQQNNQGKGGKGGKGGGKQADAFITPRAEDYSK